MSNKSGDPMGVFLSRSQANRKQGDPLSLMYIVSPHISGIFYSFPRSTAVLLNLNTNLRDDKKFKCHQRFFFFYPTIPLSANQTGGQSFKFISNINVMYFKLAWNGGGGGSIGDLQLIRSRSFTVRSRSDLL
jgi:hypothetical protein